MVAGESRSVALYRLSESNTGDVGGLCSVDGLQMRGLSCASQRAVVKLDVWLLMSLRSRSSTRTLENVVARKDPSSSNFSVGVSSGSEQKEIVRGSQRCLDVTRLMPAGTRRRQRGTCTVGTD